MLCHSPLPCLYTWVMQCANHDDVFGKAQCDVTLLSRFHVNFCCRHREFPKIQSILTDEVCFKNKYKMQLKDTVKATRFIDKTLSIINSLSTDVVFGSTPIKFQQIKRDV